MADFFNTGLSQQQFLDEYWQKKPLLIRQAFADFESPLSPDDLAGLACEPDIESRLIEENGSEGAWQVTHGPLSDDIFSQLPPTHWTMLVQDVDKHLPELQYLLNPFRFIPDWRRDDLMVSFAPEQGTVGPHTDGYDVFLLQAMGSRQWQIGHTPLHDPPLIAELDLQILAEFSSDKEWILLPGDMLYLPPHFAHHGVALNDCMTFSIGFRAPSRMDMLDSVVNTMLEHNQGHSRYSDASLQLPEHKNEIDAKSITRLKQLLHDAIDEADPILVQALGKFVTETKSSLSNLAAESMTDLPSVDEVEQQFALGNHLQRNLYTRFAWSHDSTQSLLFMAGETYSLESDTHAQVHLMMLTENDTITLQDWKSLSQHPSSTDVLCQLIAEGGWFWSEEALF